MKFIVSRNDLKLLSDLRIHLLTSITNSIHYVVLKYKVIYTCLLRDLQQNPQEMREIRGCTC